MTLEDRILRVVIAPVTEHELIVAVRPAYPIVVRTVAHDLVAAGRLAASEENGVLWFSPTAAQTGTQPLQEDR